MAKSVDDSLKELIGTFVLQNLQLQTMANQLSEDKALLEEKLKEFEAAKKPAKPTLVKDLKE